MKVEIKKSIRRKSKRFVEIKGSLRCVVSAGHGREIEVTSQNKAGVSTSVEIESKTGRIDENIYLRKI